MVVQQIGSRTELSLDGGQPFHTTEAQVTGARFIGVSGSTLLIGLWNETAGAGRIVPHYAVSLDGVGFFPARSTSYAIKLRGGGFDPLAAVPAVAESLRAEASGTVFVVQFVAPPLEAFREGIRQLGGTVPGFLPSQRIPPVLDYPVLGFRMAHTPSLSSRKRRKTQSTGIFSRISVLFVKRAGDRTTF